MAEMELNVVGWIVFAVFAAAILLLFVTEMIQPIIKRIFRNKA